MSQIHELALAYLEAVRRFYGQGTPPGVAYHGAKLEAWRAAGCPILTESPPPAAALTHGEREAASAWQALALEVVERLNGKERDDYYARCDAILNATASPPPAPSVEFVRKADAMREAIASHLCSLQGGGDIDESEAGLGRTAMAYDRARAHLPSQEPRAEAEGRETTTATPRCGGLSVGRSYRCTLPAGHESATCWDEEQGAQWPTVESTWSRATTTATKWDAATLDQLKREGEEIRRTLDARVKAMQSTTTPSAEPAREAGRISDRVKARVGRDVWDFRSQQLQLSHVVDALMDVIDEGRAGGA